MFFLSAVTSFIPYIVLLGVFLTFMFEKPSDIEDSSLSDSIETRDNSWKRNQDHEVNNSTYTYSESVKNNNSQHTNIISEKNTLLTANTLIFYSKSLTYLSYYFPELKKTFFYSSTGLRAPPKSV